MPKVKESLTDLVSEMKEIGEEIQALAVLELDTDEMETALASIKKRITKKLDSIDFVATQFDVANSMILARAELYEEEARKLKLRSASVLKNKERVFQHLADMGFVAEGKPLKTSGHTYFLKKTDGALQIDSDAKLPSEYLKTKIEQVVDKAQLRADILRGVIVDGVSIPVTQKVYRR
ncbi:MAG TPA: siphovirus Gp157 family protein [Candidatus Cloacimonadota bacterium]|nr:siphovirus Gp157 family protein [Candidatus Cloacimonadota bacterium]